MAEILTTFAHPGVLIAGNFLDFNGITSSATEGFVVPFDGEIQRISINRTDFDLTTLNIVVNGSVEHTVDTSATALVEILTIPVDVLLGDVIAVENDAGGNAISNVSASLFIQDTVALPAALTVRDLYRIEMFNSIFNGLISAHGSKSLLLKGTTDREISSRIVQIDAIVNLLMDTRP
jgi:hypothetical protein